MDIRKVFGTDKKKETEGVWTDEIEGGKFKIARIGNANYQKIVTKLQKPHRKQIRRGALPEEVSERILVEAMANAILVGWEGVTDGGVEVPYSVAKAIEYLTELRDFREQVLEVATEMENYKTELDEEAEKNCESISDGTPA